MNYYLRFQTQEDFQTAAKQAGLVNDEDRLIVATHSYAIDEIGVIRRDGVWDPETNELLEEPVTLNGWHVNLAGELPNGWEVYCVTPQNPARVWA